MVHAHSNIARYIVESITVARLVLTNSKSMAPIFKAVIKSRDAVNSTTYTLNFDIQSAVQKGDAPQLFYKDIQMIGRHYLISE